MIEIDKDKLANEYNDRESIMDISYKFSICPITDLSSQQAIEAISIYSRTTPPVVRTSTNDFLYRLQNKSRKFTFYLFSLLLNGEVIGMAMATYVNKLLIFDYIAIDEKYEDINSLYFSYIDLISKYISRNSPVIDFYITEISANENGVDRTSVRFKQLFCLNGYGAVMFPYKTLPLGTATGTSFDTWLYIKTNDKLENLDTETYLEIINAIYLNYYCAWYDGILSTNDYDNYLKDAVSKLDTLKNKLQGKKSIPVKMPTCQYAECGIAMPRIASIPEPQIRKRQSIIRKMALWVGVILASVIVAALTSGLIKLLTVDSSTFASLLSTILASITALVTTLKIK